MDLYTRTYYAIVLIAITCIGLTFFLESFITFICLWASAEWYQMSVGPLQRVRLLGLMCIGLFRYSALELQSRWAFLFIVWTTDSMAYVIGNVLGGPKIFYALSPNKTISGLLGGLVGGCAVAVLCSKPLWQGLLVSASAECGDLLESCLKRIAGLKDSNLVYFKIPGHGGLLDRIDALIFSAPVALLLF